MNGNNNSTIVLYNFKANGLLNVLLYEFKSYFQ